MDALIVYPENKDQLVALKAVMKAMKIAFEQKSDTYPDEVIKGVEKSLQQAKDGALMPYKGIDEILDFPYR
ncbi:DUF2683 family protein [Mucilaginibacter terrae]|uniref:DUF2683 family protein n=1 Tax=Mucilaginibacter terrae TaxID=1955052 RepID=UPI0036354DE5